VDCGDIWRSIERTCGETPLGCRIIFGAAAASYVFTVLPVREVVPVSLECTPLKVLNDLQFHLLLFASLIHTSLPGLVLALVICWRRFCGLENTLGTMGFSVWFISTSVVIHGLYCLLAVFVGRLLDSDWLLTSPVHGLFPLLVLALVSEAQDHPHTQVWLWPSPIHVSASYFPYAVVALSWLVHMDAHLDVLPALLLGRLCPVASLVPAPATVAWVEHSACCSALLPRIATAAGFVPAGNDLGGLPGFTTVGKTSGRPTQFFAIPASDECFSSISTDAPSSAQDLDAEFYGRPTNLADPAYDVAEFESSIDEVAHETVKFHSVATPTTSPPPEPEDWL